MIFGRIYSKGKFQSRLYIARYLEECEPTPLLSKDFIYIFHSREADYFIIELRIPGQISYIVTIGITDFLELLPKLIPLTVFSSSSDEKGPIEIVKPKKGLKNES